MAAPKRNRKNVRGTVYLIHFASPLSHARHYLGWTEGPLEERLESHRAGTGARILRACKEEGIPWTVVRTWTSVDRYFERWLKKQSNSPKFCPTCDPWAMDKGLVKAFKEKN